MAPESRRDESRRDAPLRGESPKVPELRESPLAPESRRDESRRDAPLRGESQFTAPEPRSGESPKVSESLRDESRRDAPCEAPPCSAESGESRIDDDDEILFCNVIHELEELAKFSLANVKTEVFDI